MRSSRTSAGQPLRGLHLLRDGQRPRSRHRSARRRSSRRRGRSGSRAARRTRWRSPRTRRPPGRRRRRTRPPAPGGAWRACRRRRRRTTTAISRKPTRMFTGDSLACGATVRHHLMRVKWRGIVDTGPRHRVAPHPRDAHRDASGRPTLPASGPVCSCRSSSLGYALLPLRGELWWIGAAVGVAAIVGVVPITDPAVPRRAPVGAARSWWASKRSCCSSRCWSSGSRRCTTPWTPTRVSSRGWSTRVDSVYFTVTTLSTVGYGDIHADRDRRPGARHAPDPREPGLPRHRRPRDGARRRRHQVMRARSPRPTARWSWALFIFDRPSTPFCLASL